MTDTVSKVRVHGVSMNRTILGIVNAYLVMYPQTTANELRKAFPCKITKKYEGYDTCLDASNPRKDGSGLFHEIIIENGKRVWAANHKEVEDDNFLFELPDETIHTADGKELAMESTWTEDNYNDFVTWAKQYGIEIASFEKHKGGPNKGMYNLEYLNGYVPPAPEKKGIPKWLYGLIAALAAIILILLFLTARSCNKKPEVKEIIVTKTDTVTVVKLEKEIEKIEKNFNAAKFEKGKTDLTDDAKFVLHDLQKLMNKEENKNVKLKIVGHTSKEGSDDFNQKLSEERAKTVVDFLVSQGIDSNRLTYEGKGSSEPLDPDNQELNRRTQIIVISE